MMGSSTTAAPVAPSGLFQDVPRDRVLFGPGQIERLADEVDRLGGTRALVITGQTLATKTDLVRKLEAVLGTRHVGTFSDTKQHVPSQGVMAAASAARESNADVLVSFGGGSPVDSAKLVALVLAQGFTEADQLNEWADRTGRRVPAGPLIPHIAVSTTLSAGEFTYSAGVTNEATNYKGGYGHPSMTPRVVILDPELTRATGRQLWLSTGIKALDHAVERLYDPKRQPLTVTVARESVRLLLENLPGSVPGDDGEPIDGDTLAHRGQCQVGAWFSMFGVNNDGTGLSHALGHQLGAGYGIPHGITSCVTLAHVVRYRGRRAPGELADLAIAFGLDQRDSSVADRIADQMLAFIAGLGLPTHIGETGVPRTQLEHLAEEVWKEPRARQLIAEEDLRPLLESAW